MRPKSLSEKLLNERSKLKKRRKGKILTKKKLILFPDKSLLQKTKQKSHNRNKNNQTPVGCALKMTLTKSSSNPVNAQAL